MKHPLQYLKYLESDQYVWYINKSGRSLMTLNRKDLTNDW